MNWTTTVTGQLWIACHECAIDLEFQTLTSEAAIRLCAHVEIGGASLEIRRVDT